MYIIYNEIATEVSLVYDDVFSVLFYITATL